MAKEWRADTFNPSAPEGQRHHTRTFDTRAEALAFLEGAKACGASAGFLLKYFYTSLDGTNFYDVEEMIYHKA